MKESTDLAGRYRKLLAWYPRDHRERHGEEMLGVLLAGAGDRDRPGRKETADLLRGALRLHLRRVLGVDGGIDHRDVLAIVSLLGPIAMLAGAAPLADRVAGMLQVGRWATWVSEASLIPVWTVWSLVAVLSVCRLRRTAAVGAWLGTSMLLVSPLFDYVFFWEAAVTNTGWLVFGAVVAAALTWSPGPARGWELVGGGRIAVHVAAVGTSVVLVMKSLDTYNVLFFPIRLVAEQRGVGTIALWSVALVVLVAGAVVAAGTRTREGRRAALVLSVPVVVSLLMLLLPRGTALAVVTAVCAGVPLAALLGFGSLPRRVRA